MEPPTSWLPFSPFSLLFLTEKLKWDLHFQNLRLKRMLLTSSFWISPVNIYNTLAYEMKHFLHSTLLRNYQEKIITALMNFNKLFIFPSLEKFFCFTTPILLARSVKALCCSLRRWSLTLHLISFSLMSQRRLFWASHTLCISFA